MMAGNSNDQAPMPPPAPRSCSASFSRISYRIENSLPRTDISNAFSDAAKLEVSRLSGAQCQLEEAGFRPVWSRSREHGYLEESQIPEDIGEHMDANSYRFDEVIEPLSSLFWLAGLDELEAVFDPAIALDDEVKTIPINVGVAWILEHLFEEGKLLESLYGRYFFENHPPLYRHPETCHGQLQLAIKDVTRCKHLQR
ncbi:hypothetical protein PENFLA_c020G09509 [Penicillium flavigenum]|uniref:Uncharacterized protein n=1 Tax=Penicillium flavigenum TaxID=254877 RepID=A0A1V6SY11_9EURO|nr:hypothetical protein PENFLA_c020G09509 [Penicillium flavigenum]